jgi:hypothetical protein
VARLRKWHVLALSVARPRAVDMQSVGAPAGGTTYFATVLFRRWTACKYAIPMDTNQLRVEEINELLRAVEESIQSLSLERDALDEFKDAAAYRAKDLEIQALKDQQRLLNKRWAELTAGFAPPGT